MRRILIISAILLTAISGLATAQDTRPTNQYVSASASGYHYVSNYRYHNFSIQQINAFRPSVKQPETVLTFSFTVPVDEQHFQWAAISNCLIDNSSISVSPSRAVFNAVVSDLSACSEVQMQQCTYDSSAPDGYVCVPWVGPTSAQVTGEMSGPVIQQTETETYLYSDSSVPSSDRSQCQAGNMMGTASGGVTLVFGDYSAFFPFAFESSAETFIGGYAYRACRYISKK